MPGPLDDVRVLELGQTIAGPMCEVLLLDMGRRQAGGGRRVNRRGPGGA